MKHLKAACWFGLGGLMLAQETPPATTQAEAPPQTEYSGPVILSRGEAPRLGRDEEFLRLRPYAHVNAVYDTGLTGVLTDPLGRVPSADAYGVQAGFGARGYHNWKHTSLALDYRGTLRHYGRNTYYDGMDNLLGLVLSHQATRRVSFELAESAASMRGGFYGLGGVGFYDPSFTSLAENTLFDARTHIFVSSARMIFQKSTRLSFGMGGMSTITEPRSRALVGIRGVQAIGDMAYRLSRSRTAGLDYTFHHYDFPGAFGSADMHGVAASYSVRLSRTWELDLRGGGHRLETLRLERVRIDPVIAAIIGQGVGVEAFHRILYVPQIGAVLSWRSRRSQVTARYWRGVSPGNGVYLTSGRESEALSFSFTGSRRLHLGADAGHSTYSSFSQTIGRFRNYHAGAGLTYRIGRSVYFSARIDGRKYNLRGTGFGRIYYRSSVGLAFSPGDFPLSLW